MSKWRAWWHRTRHHNLPKPSKFHTVRDRFVTRHLPSGVIEAGIRCHLCGEVWGRHVSDGPVEPPFPPGNPLYAPYLDWSDERTGPPLD